MLGASVVSCIATGYNGAVMTAYGEARHPPRALKQKEGAGWDRLLLATPLREEGFERCDAPKIELNTKRDLEHLAPPFRRGRPRLFDYGERPRQWRVSSHHAFVEIRKIRACGQASSPDVFSSKQKS
jgi:hypothetical protein